MPKIALYGLPGAGKSTLARLLTEEVVAAGSEVVQLKLAQPLYEAQSVIYELAGRPLTDRNQQDGRLLNLLGTELRRINQDALTDAFTARARQAERKNPGALLVCDDLRAPDVSAVAGLGFVLVEISAPEEARRTRKASRRDLSAGDERHPTEAPLDASPWRRVENAGSLDDLRAQAAVLAGELWR
ncbi:AAA family ATPase [Streptomyces goshikiensis]